MVDDESKHKLLLMTTHESGLEEWYCPTCGRRFLMKWPPEYQKIILEPGDEFANHTAFKGQFDPDDVPGDLPAQKPEPKSLAPWQEWMDKVNFDALWGDNP